jgi:hypothetical protein
MKNILNVLKLSFTFLLMFLILYILSTFINHFYNLLHFYDKKDIQNYSTFIKENFSYINKKQELKLIFIFDKFDNNDCDNWHGEMVKNILEKDISNNYYEHYINRDYHIFTLNITDSFNESILEVNNKKYLINNYLFIKTFKELYPFADVGINESFVYPNILSDIYLNKQYNDLNIKISMAAGNFKKFKIETFDDFTDIYSMKFFSFTKQLLFFTLFKNYFNPSNIKFNLNNLNYDYEKNIPLYHIYYSDKKSMSNNILFFAKFFPEYFLLSNNLSSSGATPLGLNNMIFKSF